MSSWQRAVDGSTGTWSGVIAKSGTALAIVLIIAGLPALAVVVIRAGRRALARLIA